MQHENWYTVPELGPCEKRAVVIGGGLAGTHAAYSLARRGWHVAVVERAGCLAGDASGNPMAIITPLITHQNDPIGEFYTRGFEYGISHIKEMSSFFRQCGVLELGKSKVSKYLQEIIPASGIAAVSQQEASALCGVGLGSKALYIEKAGYASPAELCRANIAVYSKNIEMIFSRHVLSLQKCADGWALIDGAGSEIATAPVVIIANAADANLFPECNFIPLHKVRGQLTYVPGLELCLQKVLCYDGGYIIPQIEGVSYVGATYSRNNPSTDISASDHLENINNLRSVINIGNINNAGLQGRVSFRAALPDRRPVVGAVPDIAAFYEDYADLRHGRAYKQYKPGKYLQGLYMSTGYGSRGLTACPIAGELLAAMISNEALPLPDPIINLLNPARFIIKKLKMG